MKILVLGKNGMLGNVVYNYFLELGNLVLGTDIKGDSIKYDAFENQENLESIIKDNNPNVVINCIGILNQAAEDHKYAAVKLNSLLPHYVDYLSKGYNFKFIHISTDCVYEGTIGKYKEDVPPDATSFYGKSKALGEINNNRNTTLRTSIIGPDNNSKGVGLFQWFMSQTEEVSGYTNVIWTGVTTIELAKAIEKVIMYNLTGFHHVVNNDFISKHDLLKLFKKSFNKDITINKNPDVISDKTLISTSKSFDFDVPGYEKMVDEMKEWVINHQELYPEIMNQCELGKILK